MIAENERELLDDLEAGELAVEYEAREPEEVLEWAMNRFGEDRFAIITSFQADGAVLIDMAHQLNPKVRVITIDTGRLPQEQFEIIEAFRKRYGMQIEVLFPDAAGVENMVKKHGVNLFYQAIEKRLLCCHVRKILPLNRALKTVDCWATGLRRDQWATRANIKKIEIDHDHGGVVKLSPLADWTEEDVWNYIKEYDVPTHPLYSKGYSSISCAPCTRPVPEGAHPRSGRWWWEENAPKECGMHCSIETGGFEHEVDAILGKDGDRSGNHLVHLQTS
ncbi:MAG: phosphoadenylyl-sulfate reductase [Armatimonadota bacterium]